jgi:hypothetical protein
MSRSCLYLLLFIALTTACQSEDEREPNTCLPVRYLRGICGQAVFQLQDEKNYSLGETVGTDSHVFLGVLECGTDEQTLVDKILYVEIVPEDSDTNCAVCLAAVDYAGSIRYNVRLVNPCTTPKE